ncbi:sensor histidine kinase [Streptomyces sp. NPDC056452]|uniref:sensor histidine kinase n=1 Tax=Streptomyces sp. NPDC056452 TaxID=3345821 RepID=UPI0036C5B4F9
MGRARSSHWPRQRVDAAVAAAAAAIGVANSWVKPSNGLLTGAPLTVIALVSGGTGLLLWWRHRRPIAIPCLVVACHVLAFTPTALAVALYTVGDVHHRRPRILGLFAVLATLADVAALRLGDVWDIREAGYSLALVIGPLVVGYAVALRSDLAAASQAELATREREHRLVLERARIHERARIARDMHDVVSHRVGHMVLMAAALKVGPGAQDKGVAQEAEQIRHEGRQALEELREILGVLTPDRARRTEPRAPQADARNLGDLARTAEHAGLQVDLRVQGQPESLPTVLQQALYRTVQESLTNAAKYAPGAPVQIDLECGPDRVDLSVANGPPAGPPGHDLPGGGNGLIGLRERASLLGGELEAGPEAGGFRVSLRLPAHPAPTGRDEQP